MSRPTDLPHELAPKAKLMIGISQLGERLEGGVAGARSFMSVSTQIDS
jgi:hypothetical protein